MNIRGKIGWLFGVCLFVFSVWAVIPQAEASVSVCEEVAGTYTESPSFMIPYHKGIRVDGCGKEWKLSPLLKGLVAPWDGGDKDQTRIYACHDRKYLYIMYEVSDTTLTYNAEKSESSVGQSDRVEFFISRDAEMKTYYAAEIDPQGKVMDYEAHFFRDFDFEWNFKHLKVATEVGEDWYRLELSLPLTYLVKLGLLASDGTIRIGLYRADYLDDSGERVVWSPWVVPDSPKPEFHIPSSLGCMKLTGWK